MEEEGKAEMRFVARMMTEIAEELGVKITIEPHLGEAGQIVTPEGKITFFRNTHFDLNPLGSAEVAENKALSTFFMSNMGYPVIEGDAFFSERRCKRWGIQKGINEAYQYARTLGMPVIIKPNSKSQGVGVYKVHNKREFYAGMLKIFRKDPVALVQRVVKGHDYRVVVLDDEVIVAYQRIPLTITGDGVKTIHELLLDKYATHESKRRDTILPLDNFRVKITLRRLHYSLETVLPSGVNCRILDNANLCDGGTSLDFTDSIHPGFAAICVKLTKDMGLRYAGVDLMINGTIAEPPNDYVIIEVNKAPGIDKYASSGETQKQKAREYYRKILKAVIEM